MNNHQKLTEERGNDYGTPQDNHNRTACLVQSYLSGKYGYNCSLPSLTAEDVCYFNILQKISRDMHGSNKKDTLDDIQGYVDNLKVMRGQSDE
jgi:hypothetical protein